jgi:hypothetical protein
VVPPAAPDNSSKIYVEPWTDGVLFIDRDIIN